MKYVASRLKIVGIALDDAVKVRQYADEMRIGYVLLIGIAETLGMAKDLANRTGVLPFTVALGRTGKQMHTHAGIFNQISLDSVLSPLL